MSNAETPLQTSSFSIRRIFDYALIQSALVHPSTYAAMADDFASPREKFMARMDEAIWYVGCFQVEECMFGAKPRQEFLGLWAFLPLSPIRWSVHTCLLPAIRGHAIEATRAMLEWLWANSPCERILTDVPVYNRLALKLARDVGMEEIGIDRQSIKKGGKLHDQILLGLSKNHDAQDAAPYFGRPDADVMRHGGTGAGVATEEI